MLSGLPTAVTLLIKSWNAFEPWSRTAEARKSRSVFHAVVLDLVRVQQVGLLVRSRPLFSGFTIGETFDNRTSVRFVLKASFCIAAVQRFDATMLVACQCCRAYL